MQFSPEVLAVAEDMVSRRRYIHQHPELSFEEFETTAYIENRLKEIGGYEIKRITKTGLIADLKGGHPGKRIALRADIDALPITEETDVPFRSENPGVMHACGHDAHAATMLTMAKLLYDKKESLHGDVRLIFQFGEEQPPGGAKPMVEAGAMEGVDEVFGLHYTSSYPTGKMCIREGAVTSAVDRVDISVFGKGGHSSTPEITVDPIVMSAQIILALQTIVSRRISALDSAVISVCILNAVSSSYNVIPDEVRMTASIRTFSEEVRSAMPGRIEAILKGITESAGGSYKMNYLFGYDYVINDKQITADVKKLICDVFGEDAAIDVKPFMGSEDFSAFLAKAPGYFLWCGAGNPEIHADVPHHNALYKLDEEAMKYGAEYFYRLVLRRLGAE